MKHLSILLLAVVFWNSSAAQTDGYFPDQSEYSHIPAQTINALSTRLDSVYDRYGIELPQLDSLGHLQIRMVSNGTDMIFGLYQKLPIEFGEADHKEQGQMKWNSISMPGLPGLMQLNLKYYGVSSYTSNRGSPITTQLVWVSIRNQKGQDLIGGAYQNYRNLSRYFKRIVDSIEPMHIPLEVQEKLKN